MNVKAFMIWYLFELKFKDGVYYPSLLQSFDDLDAALSRQRQLQGEGVDTQLVNRPDDTPHRIFDIGVQSMEAL